MERAALLRGDELLRVIPQREPIVMIDTLYECGDSYAVSGLTVRDDNMFFVDDCLNEAGLVEHIAQSVAAFAGYGHYLRGERPRLGYIGEIKRMEINWLPSAGDELRTRIEKVADVDEVTLVVAETEVEGDVIASCQLKIFMSDEQ